MNTLTAGPHVDRTISRDNHTLISGLCGSHDAKSGLTLIPCLHTSVHSIIRYAVL